MLLFLYFNKVDLNIFFISSMTTYFIMILKRYLNLVSSAETNNDLLLLENIVLGIQISELKSIGSLKHWQFTNTTYKSHLVHNLTIKISSFQRLWSIEIDWKETVKIAWTRNTYYYKCYVNFLYNYFFFPDFQSILRLTAILRTSVSNDLEKHLSPNYAYSRHAAALGWRCHLLF